MNNYKIFGVPILLIINVICVLIYINSIIFNGEIILCDSNECINDFVADPTQDNNTHSIHPTTGIFIRFKRKLSWYINGKKSGRFSSYDEYKDTWTNTSLWKTIKDDFRKTRSNVSKDSAKSLKQNERLMTDIYNERRNKNIMDQECRNIVNTK